MFAAPVLIGLASGAARAADLEGTPTFGQFPGVAGLLESPSRLAWEGAPLVAVGAALVAGAPELDLSVRGERWTGALALTAPISGGHDVIAGAEDEEATRAWQLSADPWIGLGIARQRARGAWGLSLVAQGEVEVLPAELDGTSVSEGPGTGTIEWRGDRPTRGTGSAGHATGQDLDTALHLGFARTDGADWPRVDLVARYLRSGEFLEVAEGPETEGTLPYTTGATGPAFVDSIRGANPASFWGFPNRSAATLGATVGLDQGGTLQDPRSRWTLGAEAGPTWTTFTETITVTDRYTAGRDQSRVTLDGGGGYRVAGHAGGALGRVTDDGRWRIRAGGHLAWFREDHQPITCRPGVETMCTPSSRLTEYAVLSGPTAVEMAFDERVTASVGVSPSAYVYQYRVRLEQDDPDPEPVASVLDLDFAVRLGARGAIEYSHRGWVFGAVAGGSYVTVVGYGGYGGSAAFGGAVSDADLQPPPRPDAVAYVGPTLASSLLIWIGWRPEPPRDG